MSDGEDKRRHPRYEVRGLAGNLRYDMNARVLNLSVDGMALETTSWLHVGKDYQLKIGSGDDCLDIVGRVVWCHLVGNRTRDAETRPIYQAGVQFGEALSEQARRILSFVRRAGVVGVASRVFGRFRVRQEEAVDVAFEHAFEVRRVSLSGLLLEADLLPEVGSRFALEIPTPAGTLTPSVTVKSLEQSATSGGAPVTRIGVEFVNLSDDDRQIVEALISEQLEAGEGATADD
jgi:hypothetical protein